MASQRLFRHVADLLGVGTHPCIFHAERQFWRDETRRMPTDSWPVRHFSQASPADGAQDDVPALLRRVAASIEGLGDVDVQDITFHTEITAEGPRHSLTVYFHAADDRGEDHA